MTVQPPSDLDYSDTKLLVEELRAHRHVWMGRSRRVLEGLRAADQPFRIHLVSPATRDKNFYILLTEGLSLHAMPAPPELAGKGLERIELMLLLPPTLPLENVRESWYVKLVTKLARQVMQQEDFLCWGSRFENGEPFVPDSRLCGGVLLNCGILPSAASICNIRPGLCVRYYQIMLLTRQELDYQAACGTDALLELLAGSVTSVTDLSRRNIADSGYLMDWEAIHAGTIRRKDLPRMEIEGFSHMAVYLRWCIEHNLMSEAFQQDFPEEIQKVLENEDNYFDLRTSFGTSWAENCAAPSSTRRARRLPPTTTTTATAAACPATPPTWTTMRSICSARRSTTANIFRMRRTFSFPLTSTIIRE